MFANDAKRWMHGGALRMPSEQQVVGVHGSWDAALSAAGLQSTTQHERNTRNPRRAGEATIAWPRSRYLKEAGGNHPTATGYKDWRSTQKAAPALSNQPRPEHPGFAPPRY